MKTDFCKSPEDDFSLTPEQLEQHREDRRAWDDQVRAFLRIVSAFKVKEDLLVRERIKQARKKIRAKKNPLHP